VLRVPHVRQSYNWSAACLLALLLSLSCCFAVLDFCFCISKGLQPEEQHHICSWS
jgi:hypothetical protein